MDFQKCLLILLAFIFKFGMTETMGEQEAVTSCVKVSVPEDAVRLIQDTARNISLFLHDNLETGHSAIRKALERIGPAYNANEESNLQVQIQQYQNLLHKDFKAMIADSKRVYTDIMETLDIKESSNEIFLPGEEDPDYPPSFVAAEAAGLFEIGLLKGYLRDESKRSPFKNVAAVKKFKEEFPSTTDYQQRPGDCSEILVAGGRRSGVYKIYPFRCFCSPGIKVYCDQETDGGGWTVIMNKNKHGSKHTHFNRTWQEYRDGFGDPNHEFWIGLDALHLISSSRSYFFRAEASNEKFGSVWGQYSNFLVADKPKNYLLTLTGFDAKSTMVDRLGGIHNGKQFSTRDSDNDKNAKTNCAEKFNAGWWYTNTASYCHLHLPTGSMDMNPWSKTDGSKRTASKFQLKIRPKVCSDTASIAYFNTHNCYSPVF